MIGRNGSSFGLASGLALAIAGRLVVGQDLLERVPVELVLAAGRTLAEAVDQTRRRISAHFSMSVYTLGPHGWGTTMGLLKAPSWLKNRE